MKTQFITVQMEILLLKLEDDQKLIMTYQEYYNITVKEDIPEGGVAGRLLQKKEHWILQNRTCKCWR